MKIFIYIFCLFLNTTLQANSLEEALSLAYKKNPSIQAKRAELRSNDELVSLSSSEFFPKIRFIGSYGELVTNYKEVDEIRLRPNVAKIEAEQIIFSGGRLVNNRSQSLNLVAAGRADLEILEQEILFSAAEAFFNVLTNEKKVEITTWMRLWLLELSKQESTHKTTIEQRENAMKKANRKYVPREWMLKEEIGMSCKNMCERFVHDMEQAFEKWTPRKRFTLYKA